MNKKILFNPFIIIIIAVTFSLFSCKNNERKNEVSSTELKKAKEKGEWELYRYEKDLFDLDTTRLAEGVKTLAEKYPPYFIEENAWENEILMQGLQGYLSDPEVREIFAEVMKVFPNNIELEAAFKEAFAYYLVYFPEAELPNIVTTAPGIDLSMPSVYPIDNSLIVNLDLYLGANYPKYNTVGMPKYISQRCDKKYIVIDCFKNAIAYQHLALQEQPTLLDAMIYEGKRLVFAEYMNPEAPVEDIIGFTKEQYRLANTYYGNIWNHIIEKGELYSTSSEPARRYLEEAPFTKPFGNQAPGRMGQFIGWQIAKAYMEKNPEVTLAEMMKLTDSSEFLTKGNFKPRAN